MKQKLLLSLFVLLSATTVWADVEINETNFPDANFRNWVLREFYGADGVLKDYMIAGVTNIDVSLSNIKSLKGIEYFTALTRLTCYQNQLTELDLSKNTALTFLRCENNQLTSLDVSQNTRLGTLQCGDNQLTSLDVSQNTALGTLQCENNQLTSLDVSQNTKLTELICSQNQLTSLDVSQNTKLRSLNCSENQLTSLDVSQNTALILLTCFNNQLTSLDVSHNTALIYLYCQFNQLTTLVVSQNKKLTTLWCNTNRIKGAAMDALVEGLPTVSNGMLKVIHNTNEQNVMTTVQVSAANAKGWKTYEFDGSAWQEYAGSEPEPEAIAEETTVNPAETATPGAATTVDGVTTSLGSDDEVNVEEGSVTMHTAMTAEEVSQLMESVEPGSSEFSESFKGICFQLAAGKGKIELVIETLGDYAMGVMKGTELLGEFTTTEKGTVSIPYDLTEDTWFYLFPTTATKSSARRRAEVAAEGLKIYTVSIVPGGSEPIIKGDLNGDSKIDIADAVSVLDLMAEGKDDPAADLNGDGKVDIADFVSVLDLMAAQ